MASGLTSIICTVFCEFNTKTMEWTFMQSRYESFHYLPSKEFEMA